MEAISVWDGVRSISFLDYEPTINFEEARRRRYEDLPSCNTQVAA